jgi:hypothetical protein
MNYITFKTISEAGNLASQIQQYASLYAIAKENNLEIIFPISSLSKGYGFKFAKALEIPIKTENDEFFNDFIDIRPNDKLLVDKSLFNLEKGKNYNLTFRYDLFHYWYPKYKTDIDNWNWNQNHLNSASDIYKKIKIKDKELVSLHIRRGDYLLPQHSHYCQLDQNYYSQALSSFFEDIEKYQFIIFSNDIEWCKENLLEESEIVTFIEPGVDYVDLVLMSLCDHNIIANSSYSLWAAFKNNNPNKKVYCPTNYLKNSSAWAHINGNYYPKEWINIDNKA